MFKFARNVGKTITATFLILMLAGCATTWKPVPVEPKVVVKQEYIIRIPPADTMTFPAEVPNIDPDKATQADVAEWIVKKEEQVNSFKSKLEAIAKFLSDEKAKLDAQAAQANSK